MNARSSDGTDRVRPEPKSVDVVFGLPAFPKVNVAAMQASVMHMFASVLLPEELLRVDSCEHHWHVQGIEEMRLPSTEFGDNGARGCRIC